MVVNIVDRNTATFAQGTKIDWMPHGVDGVAATVAARRALEKRQATQLPMIVSQRPDAGTLDAADTGRRFGQDAQRHIQRRLAEICPPRQAGHTLLQVFGGHQGIAGGEVERVFHRAGMVFALLAP